MNTVRYIPASSVGMLRPFDELFERLMGPPATTSERAGSSVVPPVDVWEDERAIYVEAEVPGFTMNQLRVQIEQNTLTIAGERSACGACGEERDARYLRRERGCGSFNRTFTVASEIDAEKIGASLKEGVLLVTLPKSKASKTRTIAINAN